MRALIDINVILDVLFVRQPWFQDARAIWQAHEDGLLTGYLAGSAMTDIFYIGRRLATLAQAWDAVETCLDTFSFCTVDDRTLAAAWALPHRDFEDNVLIACASLAGLDAIITRDTADFADSPVAVLTPAAAPARVGRA